MRTQHYFFLNEILFITCNADYFCIHTVHAVPQMTAGCRWQNCANPTFMSNYNLCLSVHLSFICYRCVNNFVFIATSFLIYIICKCTSAGIYFWRISCSFWVINLVLFFSLNTSAWVLSVLNLYHSTLEHSFRNSFGDEKNFNLIKIESLSQSENLMVPVFSKHQNFRVAQRSHFIQI